MRVLLSFYHLASIIRRENSAKSSKIISSDRPFERINKIKLFMEWGSDILRARQITNIKQFIKTYLVNVISPSLRPTRESRADIWVSKGKKNNILSSSCPSCCPLLKSKIQRRRPSLLVLVDDKPILQNPNREQAFERQIRVEQKLIIASIKQKKKKKICC